LNHYPGISLYRLKSGRRYGHFPFLPEILGEQFEVIQAIAADMVEAAVWMAAIGDIT
jgi:hypothetical protein